MLIAYAKGARTFERHIDIDVDGVAVSPYCTLPHQCDDWFQAYAKARRCAVPPERRSGSPAGSELEYLDGLLRGVYAACDLDEGATIDGSKVFLAVPLLKGQLSCRELIAGDVLVRPLRRGEPITMDCLESPSDDARDVISGRISQRGLVGIR